MNMKQISKKIILAFFLMITLNTFSQVINVYNTATIQGAVDVNGKPTQLLSSLTTPFGTGSVLEINANGVIIRNVIIDASNQNIGIKINSKTNVTIENVVIINAKEHGIFASNSSNLIVRNSDISNNGLSQNVSNTFWPGVNGYADYSNANGVKEMKFAGIYVDNSSGSLIEGNSVYGNKGHGIKIINTSAIPNGSTYSVRVLNNLVGIKTKKSEPQGNFGDGILLTTSSNILVDGNTSVANGNRSAWNGTSGDIAKDASAGLDPRNFYGVGIELNGGGSHTVTRNFVGTYDGTSILSPLGAATGNQKHGIYVRSGSKNNKIGVSGQGNIVGGNGYAFGDVHTKDTNPAVQPFLFGVAHGITLHDDGGFTSGNKVQANFVGYYNGSCIPNRQDGISLLGFYSGGTPDGLTNNLIGGAGAGEGNVIAGGMFGIFAQGQEVEANTIQGNFIGTDGPAMTNIGCAPSDGGIVLQTGASNTLISGNYIAHISDTNSAIIVKNTGSIKNQIVANFLTCNNGGIDLQLSGNNDFGNSPTQLAVNTLGSTSTSITGVTPNLTDKIDVYIADSCSASAPPCQAPGGNSDKAQGLRLITTITPVANTLLYRRAELGYFDFDLTSPIAVTNKLTHDNVIFLARSVNNNTSEFHKCIAEPLCEPPATVNITTPVLYNLCTGGSAAIAVTLTKVIGDPTPLADFTFALYKIPGDTLISENKSGSFTVTKSGTYKVYAYNAKNKQDCGKWSTKEVVVNIQNPATPAIITQTTPGKLCVNQTNVQFSVSGGTGSSYKWTISNDPTWTRTGTSITVASVTENFTLTIVETTASPFNCPQVPVTLPVVVNPLPQSELVSGKADVCAGDTIVYSVPFKAGFSYSWTVNATDAVLVADSNRASIVWGSNSGTVSVVITNENGCVGANPSTLAVTVNALPLSKTISGKTPICAGTVEVYSVTGTTSTYVWTQDGVALTSTSNQVTVTIPDAATTKLELIETNEKGCVSKTPAVLSIVVNERPKPINLQALPSPDVCIGDSYKVKVDVQNGIEFVWASLPAEIIPTQSVSNELILVGTKSGLITVSAKNPLTGCESNLSEKLNLTINVHELPSKPIIDGPENVNCNASETFTISNSKPTSKYIWYYGVEATGDPVEGDTTNKSTAIVSFGSRRAEIQAFEIDQFGCESGLAEVNPFLIGCDPVADFSVDKLNYCLGQPVTIKELATYTKGGLEEIKMWLYFTGADVDSLEVLPGGSVKVNYLAAGTYNVKMILHQGPLSDTLDSVGVVVIKPLATIKNQSLIGNTSICQNFEGSYSVIPNPGSIYTWSYTGATELGGSTNTSKNLRFGPTAQDVSIRVIENRNGCIDTLDQVIDVLPTPKKLGIDGPKSVCENEEFNLTLNGASLTSTYDWTPLVNIITFNPTKTVATLKFPLAGDYKVTVMETDVNGCFSLDSISSVMINVKKIPDAPVISGLSLKGVCEGIEANFSTANVTGFIYNWSVVAPDVIKSTTLNNVVIKPSGTGLKTVSLSVTNNGCISKVTDSTYVVQESPKAPEIIANGPNYCEASTATFSVKNPNSSSTYCWTLPVNSRITSGFTCGLSNNEIKVLLGSIGGNITVTETTSIGCSSIAPGIVPVNITKLLGNVNVVKFFEASICSGSSIDSLAKYEVNVENASSVTYQISPSISSGAYTAVNNGQSGTLSVVFPKDAEGINFEVKAIVKSGTCDTKEIPWNVNVKASETVAVAIDNRDVCEGDDVKFTASIAPKVDAQAKYTWYLNDVLLSTGPSVIIKRIEDNDDLKVVYKGSNGNCPNLAESKLSQSVRIQAWVKPEIDGMISGNGVVAKVDNYGKEYYQISTKQEIDLEGELLINKETGAVYNYSFYWKNSGIKTFSSIAAPNGIIPSSGSILTSANLVDMPNGVKERVYYVEANVNGICATKDSMRIKIDFALWIPNVVKPGCGCADGIWTIDNIQEFPNNTVVIYNRWGSVVRTYGHGEFKSWDGTNDNGQELPMGTYYYTVSLGESGVVCTGPVTILR